MATNSSPLQGLAQARGLALENPALYTKILPGILPFIGSNSALDLRTWGAAFLAETFASPVLPQDDKQTLSLQVLPLLKEYLDAPDQDFAVVKTAVQASATIYPLIFRYMYVSTLSQLPKPYLLSISPSHPISYPPPYLQL
jgi:symplekin